MSAAWSKGKISLSGHDVGADRVRAVFEGGDDAEVAAPPRSAQNSSGFSASSARTLRPSTVTISQAEQVVDGCAVAAHEMSDSAAEGQSGDAGAADGSGGYGEAVSCAASSNSPEQDARLSPYDPRLGVDGDRLHLREVDDEGAAGHRVPVRAVPASAYGHGNAAVRGVTQDGRHVVLVDAPGDQRGAFVGGAALVTARVPCRTRASPGRSTAPRKAAGKSEWGAGDADMRGPPQARKAKRKFNFRLRGRLTSGAMTPPTPPARPPHAGRRPREHPPILRTARTVFADRGYEVSIEEVARRSGVGMGTDLPALPEQERPRRARRGRRHGAGVRRDRAGSGGGTGDLGGLHPGDASHGAASAAARCSRSPGDARRNRAPNSGGPQRPTGRLRRPGGAGPGRGPPARGRDGVRPRPDARTRSHRGSPTTGRTTPRRISRVVTSACSSTACARPARNHCPRRPPTAATSTGSSGPDSASEPVVRAANCR